MTIEKKSRVGQRLAMLALVLQALLWRTTLVFARQDPNIQVDINTDQGGGGAWYTVWWVWVLIAMFIIVIVALTSRGKASQ